MDVIASQELPRFSVRNIFLALLVVSVTLSVLPVQSAHASTNYIDTFSTAPITSPVSTFSTGTPATGLSYTCTNCSFSPGSEQVQASQLLGPSGSSLAITARDGDAFDFNSIRVTSPSPIIITGYGPEPFSISLLIGTGMPVTVSPASPSRVTRVEITPSLAASSFNLFFDDVDVVLYEPEVDLQRQDGTSIPHRGTDDVGSLPHETISLTYVIANLGDSALTIENIGSFYWTNVSNVRVRRSSSTVPPGGTATCTFTVDIAAEGPFSFTGFVQTNDANEHIYWLNIEGVRDTVPPGATSFARHIPSTSPTAADTLIFRATFSEDVLNVDTADFQVSGTTASITNVNPVSAAVYDITVAGGDLAGLNGTVGLNLAAGQDITDRAGNALPAGEPATDETYSVDNAPSLVSFTRQTPAASLTNTDTLVFRATFDEPVQNVDGADFAASGTTAGVTGVNPISTSVYDLTVSGGDLAGLNGVIGLDLAVGQNIIDTVGNALPAGEPATDETYQVDNTGPTPEITQAAGQPDPTAIQPVNFAVNFGEAVTGFGAGDLSFGGTAPGSPAAVVTGGPQSYNVAVSGLTCDGTLTVSFAPGAAQDAAGNPSAAPTLTDNQVTFDGDPEVDLQRPAGTAIPAGGTDALGNTPIGRVSLTYTIDNSAGTDVLTVTSVTASSPVNVSGFSLDTALPLSVTGGDTTTMELSFDVGVDGPFSLDLSLANNDGDEDPYNVTISGTGTGGLPEIDVQRAGTAIPDDGADPVGTPGVGTVHLTYTLDNSAGTAALNVTGVTASNLTNVGNVIVSPGSLSVPALAAGSVDLSFDVLADGPFSFDLAVASDDGDENPYDIHISGAGLELQVLMTGDTAPLDGDVLYAGPDALHVQFNKDVQTGGGSGAADNPANYLLVEAGPDGAFSTTSCAIGTGGDDGVIAILNADYDSATHTATLDVAGAPLPNGSYRLLVCGTTSVMDLFDIELNNGAADTPISFLVTDPPTLPATGFAPDRITTLPARSAGNVYQALGGLWLEIPALGVQAAITGVPQTETGWDVSWLGDHIGYLAGTAFPTWDGNTGLTGHVTGADGLPGPFAQLSELSWGERVLIHAFGHVYTYEVRSVEAVRPADSRSLTRHEDYDWITLITCRGYYETRGVYAYRSVVRAVLVRVEAE